MDKIRISQLKSVFDDIVHFINNDEDTEQVEIWFARELQVVLGYARWENFIVAISRAVDSCKSQNINVDDHFREVTKMVGLGSGAKREVNDYMLTRYACYLIAQNGDPKKEEIAFAQSYFAIQTRKAELIEERLNLLSRLETRDKLRASEKQLSHTSTFKTIQVYAKCLASEVLSPKYSLLPRILKNWSAVCKARKRRLKNPVRNCPQKLKI